MNTGQYVGSQAILYALPPRFIRLVAAGILVLAFSMVLFALLAPLSNIVTCRFVLETGKGSDPIRVSHTGVITDLTIQEGQWVESGEVLYRIKSDELASLKGEAATIKRTLAETTSLSKRADDNTRASLEALADVRSPVTRELSLAQKSAGTQGQIAKRTRKAVTRGVISISEGDQAELRWLDELSRVEALKRRLAEMTVETAGIMASQTQRHVATHLSNEPTRARLAAIQARLTSVELDDFGLVVVRAPYDGVVTQLKVRREEVVGTRGDVVLFLIRDDTHLRAKLKVPEKEAAMLQPQLNVRLEFDSYPYSRFGSLAGTIDWIAPAARDGQIEVIVTLHKNSFEVNGTPRITTVGMRGQARIVVGHHTLYELVSRPLNREKKRK